MKNRPEGIVLDLPLPPSTNHLFATVGRKRIKTKKYKQWISECMNECIVQGKRGQVNSEPNLSLIHISEPTRPY